MSNESTLPAFNPSGKEEVAAIKENVPDNRCRSIALTNYEQAAMWAVKANFV